MIRILSEAQLARCGSILLPKDLWPLGAALDHPELGYGTLKFRDDDGRMTFEFKGGDWCIGSL